MTAEVREGRARRREGESGMTMLEVIVALVILSTCALPLLIALADAQRQIVRSHNKRVMKQLLEYKLAHVLLDRPAEGEEPIYVDGAEGNFGEDFLSDPDKAYWTDEGLYNYSYRIDSEELDLGTAGGVTGEEESSERERRPLAEDPGGDPTGAFGGEAEEEELGQLRYRVTLTVFYRPGNANFDQHMSVVTYVKHPHVRETMTGPDLGGAGGAGGAGAGGLGGIGGGEARAGGATDSLRTAVGGGESK